MPARTLQELGRIADAPAARTRSLWPRSRTRWSSRSSDVVLSSRLVEGRFPNYQQLLPETYEHELRVSRDELLEVVRRVGLLAQKNAPLRLRFAEGALDVSAQTPDVGEASESLPVAVQGRGRSRSASTPSSSATGSRARSPRSSILKLISPLRPGLIQSGGRGRRLPLPRHADPPERLDAPWRGHAHRAARLPQLRALPSSSSARRPHRRRGPERRRQDQPARGALLRLHRALLPRPRTSASWCVAARRSRGWRSTPRRRGRRAPARGRLRARRAEAPARGRRRPSTAWPRVESRPLVSVFLPERLELVKGAPSGAARAPRPARRGALAGAGGDAGRLLARARPAQRAAGAHPRRRAGPAGRSTPGTPSWPGRGSQLMADRAEAVDGPRGARSPSSRAALGLPGQAELRYRPRSPATDAEELAAELGERRDADLERGFTAHGPHRDELAAAARRRARCARTARRASSASRCWRSCSPSATLLAERRAAAPLMLLDDVMSELDADRRELLAELVRSGGQAVVTTTEPEHVPGAAQRRRAGTSWRRAASRSTGAAVAA